MKILIVDDNEIDISVIRQAVSNLDGVTGHFATTPDDAIELAISIKPDLIIMDVMMPNMDGIELRSRLSRHIHTSSIPVVFITASAEEKEKDCYRVGCIDFLTKPVDIDKLVNIVVEQSFIAKLDDLIASNRKLCHQLECCTH